MKYRLKWLGSVTGEPLVNVYSHNLASQPFTDLVTRLAMKDPSTELL